MTVRRRGRSRARAWRDAGLALLAGLALVLSGRASAAGPQTVPSPPPAVLVNITAVDDGHGATQVTLAFAPQAPGFSIVSNDDARVSIAFALSSRGSTARLQGAPPGVLRSVDFEQS